MRNPVTRRALAIVAALVATLVVLAVEGWHRPGEAAFPVQPHVIVIMADDLDVPTVETLLALGFLPNLQQHVVGRGVRFRQSFVTNSLCCPSRATYLSGRYSHNHGVLRNNAPYGSITAFTDPNPFDGSPRGDLSTVATWLRAAGYRTAHVGKYLNGMVWTAPETSPLSPHYVPWGWNRWEALVGLSTYDVYGYWMSMFDDLIHPDRRGRLRPPCPAPGTLGEPPAHCEPGKNYYQTTFLAERAASVILEAKIFFPTQPLFLTVTPLAPHVEMRTIKQPKYPDAWCWTIRPDPRDQTEKPFRWNFIYQNLPLLPQSKPAFNEPDVTDKPAPLQRPKMTADDVNCLTRQYRDRFASMLAVDDLIGTVAAALGDHFDNTVIVFTSDNGYLYGEHRMVEKIVPYEESIRVPLYIAGPGVSGARMVDALVVNNDLAPTIAQLASALPWSPIDGRSLVSLLGGETPSDWRKRFVVEHWVSGPLSGDTPATDLDVPTYAALRTGPDDVPYPNRLYVEHFNDPTAPDRVTDVELYDLNDDPDQMNSLHLDASRAGELTALHEQLTGLRGCGRPETPSCQSLEH